MRNQQNDRSQSRQTFNRPEQRNARWEAESWRELGDEERGRRRDERRDEREGRRYQGSDQEREYGRRDERESSFERRFSSDRDRGFGQADRFDRSYATAYREEGMDRGDLESSTRRYAGRGPRGYKRSDERIREDVSELLTRNSEVDATDIEVEVREGEVVLRGTVIDRRMKRVAEELAEDVSGVRDVTNQIKVRTEMASGPTVEENRETEGSLGSKSLSGKKIQGGTVVNH